MLLQGEWGLSVKSNLAMTDKKSARNFNLIMNSVQGRVGIYASMIRVILSWPLLASETSFFTIHLFTWLFGQKHQKLQTLKLSLLADLMTFSVDFNNALLTHEVLRHSNYFCTIYGTFQTFRENLKKLNSAINGVKMVRMSPYLVGR